MPLLRVKKRGKELRRFSFTGDIITIGRDSLDEWGGPDLPLRDTSRRVSRYHAVVVKDRRGYYFVRDLASANGTFVNGRLVYGRRLHDSDVVGIGDFELCYSESEQVTADLSQAVRVMLTAPAERGRSEKTALEDVSSEQSDRMSDRSRHTMHDILQRLRLLPDDENIFDELLTCAASAVDARRGVIAGVNEPFALTPEAIYGIDIDHGEQLGVAAEYIHQVLSDGNAVVAFFAGTAILCSPVSLAPDRKGIIYLECERGQCFSEEDRVFLDLLCRRLPRTLHRFSNAGGERESGADERFRWEAEMVAKSPEMKEIIAEIDRCTDIASNVLLRGPTGTGKEITARSIHARSARSAGPFVAVELSNLDKGMVSSVLFGWKKGSYTGADHSAEGAFHKADGGTIYLDEIGDISHEVQMKLRRAVEEKQISPVGSSSVEDVDVKVIAATNVDLDRAVETGEFRRDLLLRFGRQIELPPLKERRADIPILTYFFIDQMETKLQAVSHGAMRLLIDYDWPGNIRELREVLKELAARNKEIIFNFDLPERMRQPGSAEGEGSVSTVEDMERREIIRVLRTVNWNKTRAYRILGYGSKQTLYNKIKKYHITPPSRHRSDDD